MKAEGRRLNHCTSIANPPTSRLLTLRFDHASGKSAECMHRLLEGPESALKGCDSTWKVRHRISRGHRRKADRAPARIAAVFNKRCQACKCRVDVELRE